MHSSGVMSPGVKDPKKDRKFEYANRCSCIQRKGDPDQGGFFYGFEVFRNKCQILNLEIIRFLTRREEEEGGGRVRSQCSRGSSLNFSLRYSNTILC